MRYTEPIIKNKNGDIQKPWHIEFEFDEVRIRAKTGKMFNIKIQGKGNRSNNKKDRQIYFQNLRSAIKKKLKEGWKPVPDQFDLTIIEGLDYALKVKKQETKSTTWTDYESRLRKFTKFLIKHKLEKKKSGEIIAKDIRAFFIEIAHLAPKTITNYRICLHAFFEVMRKEKMFTENPVAGIKRKHSISETHVTYSPGLMKKVLIAAKEYYPNLFLCMLLEYHCYLRPQFEIGGLKWRNIDLKQKTVTVIPRNAKSDTFRTIPVHDDIIKILRSRKQEGEYVFGSDVKDGYVNKDYFGVQFKRLRKKVEIPKGYTLYAFKHTGACNLYQATKDIYLVSKMLGHTSIKTTEIYLRSLGQNILFLSQNPLPSITDDLDDE